LEHGLPPSLFTAKSTDAANGNATQHRPKHFSQFAFK